MVGADRSTELWRHPLKIVSYNQWRNKQRSKLKKRELGIKIGWRRFKIDGNRKKYRCEKAQRKRPSLY